MKNNNKNEKNVSILNSGRSLHSECSADSLQYGRSMIEMLEKVKQPLNAVLRRLAQVFRCCQLAYAPRRNTENQVTEAPLGARQRRCALAQSGRSMIEMLGVLAIIGVLSVGGIAGYSKAMMKYRTNKTIEQITLIAGNVRTFFAPQKSYNGLGSSSATGYQLLKKANLVPDEMWVSVNMLSITFDLSHPFGGGFGISSTPKIENEVCYNDTICNSGAFSLLLVYIPVEACIDIITQDWSELNVTEISVDNTNHMVEGDETMYALATPIDIATATKVCHSDDGLVNMSLDFDTDITQGESASDIAETKAKLEAM